jgi:teichoic acid transport system ATP-binding protein
VAFTFAFLLVLTTSGGDDGDGDGGSQANRTEQREPAERTTTRRERRTPATYRVEVGDTLAGIAEKTGLTVERIQELNPDIDPQALVAGQELKLRE